MKEESKNTFRIYDSSQGLRVSGKQIVFLLILSVFMMVCLHIISGNGQLLVSLIMCFIIVLTASLLINLIYFLKHGTRKKPPEKTIAFYNDRIVVNEKAYLLDELEKVSFFLEDYKGKYPRRYILERWAGKFEEVCLFPKGQEPLVFFLNENSKNSLLRIKEQLISYYLSGKLNFLQLIELLGIKKYNDIQEFKKYLATFDNSQKPL